LAARQAAVTEPTYPSPKMLTALLMISSRIDYFPASQNQIRCTLSVHTGQGRSLRSEVSFTIIGVARLPFEAKWFVKKCTTSQ